MKLPKRVFVKWVENGKGDPWLETAEDCESLADESEGKWKVGVYELVTTGTLASKATFAADKAKAKR